MWVYFNSNVWLKLCWNPSNVKFIILELKGQMMIVLRHFHWDGNRDFAELFLMSRNLHFVIIYSSSLITPQALSSLLLIKTKRNFLMELTTRATSKNSSLRWYLMPCCLITCAITYTWDRCKHEYKRAFLQQEGAGTDECNINSARLVSKTSTACFIMRDNWVLGVQGSVFVLEGTWERIVMCSNSDDCYYCSRCEWSRTPQKRIKIA